MKALQSVYNNSEIYGLHGCWGIYTPASSRWNAMSSIWLCRRRQSYSWQYDSAVRCSDQASRHNSRRPRRRHTRQTESVHPVFLPAPQWCPALTRRWSAHALAILVRLCPSHQPRRTSPYLCNNYNNKKVELPQRWSRDAPHIWVPWKFSRVPEYAHGYFSRNF